MGFGVRQAQVPISTCLNLISYVNLNPSSTRWVTLIWDKVRESRYSTIYFELDRTLSST